MIQDLCEENRLRIDPAIGDGRISAGELQVGNSLGDAAQGCGCVIICFCQGGDPKFRAYSTPSWGVTVSIIQRTATIFIE